MKDEEIDEEKGVLNLKEKGLNQIIEIINNFEQLEKLLKVKNQFYIK